MLAVSPTCRLLLVVGLALSASPLLAELQVERVEPAAGETLSRPPRTLRIWFSQEPDVDASELRLEGPAGTLQLEGLHTMDEKDLMVRIVGRVVDGEYTAQWRMRSRQGDDEQTGTWTFTVKRGGS